MAELVDPEKLVSVAQIAKEYGYNSKYFSHLAAAKKFKAWHIGNTWVTTREIIIDYVKSAPPPGRPRVAGRKSPKK